MERSEKGFDVGVIVGRFQVDDLTEGHKILIDEVIRNHKRVIIFLGLSPAKCTVNNPLDFEARRLMLKEVYPDIEVAYITDVSSNTLWCDTLDRMIVERLHKEKMGGITVDMETVCLYGGRDSFLEQYCGKFPCRELAPESYPSGTERRKELSRKVNKSRDFRHGVIWAIMNQWPACQPTVDIAIFNENFSRILLGRKPEEVLFRLVGGFVEPGDTYEQTVEKEAVEETHLRVLEAVYLKSFLINDWRYKSEVNKITSALFITNRWEGTPEPGDDIAELRWFPFNKNLLDSVVKEHIDMFEYLLIYVNRK